MFKKKRKENNIHESEYAMGINANYILVSIPSLD